MNRNTFGTITGPVPMRPDQIRWVRKTGGWDVTGFAAWLGVTRQSISNWESGRSSPTGPVLRVLNILEEEYSLLGLVRFGGE